MRLASLVLAFAVTFGLANGAEPAPASFADVVRDHFAAWDLNHDGRIEGKEIDALMSRRSIRGEAAAALAVLKLRERRTPAAVRPGFTLSPHDIDDIDALTDPVALDPAKGPPKPFHAQASYQRYLKVLQSVEPRLYAGAGPDFAAMKQGPIGDCYFFCLTGFLAAKHPHKIRDMIRTMDKGNYTVKFFDGESFTVNAPTEAELLVNNSASSLEDGVWLCVLEKALGKRLRARSKDGSKRTAEPTDAMASGGSTANVMMLYSGHKVKGVKLRDAHQTNARLQELRREIPVTLAHGRMASVEMGDPPSGSPKVRGLGYHHAYAIMAFDPKSDRVTVWNPWGQNFKPKGPDGAENGFTTEHGIFHIPLATLYRQFSNVHLETTEPAKIDAPNHNRRG